MGLILQALSGPLKGRSWPLTPGREIVIGRKGATIHLEDPKVSSVHAIIRETDGEWLLSDNDSKNGVRDDKGDNLPQMKLRPGLVFQIGDSKFEVGQVIEPELMIKKSAAKPKADPKAPRRWDEILNDFLQKEAKRMRDHAKDAARTFDSCVVLDFVRGAQAQSRWILGYGPRQIGAGSAELTLLEKKAPAVCFELHPHPEGVQFKTDHPDIVKLNGEGVDSRILHVGDKIQIMDTLIEVDFTE